MKIAEKLARRANLLAKGHVIAVGFEFALAQTFFRDTQKV